MPTDTDPFDLARLDSDDRPIDLTSDDLTLTGDAAQVTDTAAELSEPS